MKTSTFVLLVVVTLAAIGGAYWSRLHREAGIADILERQRLYPELLSRVNDATKLVIRTQADGTLTLHKDAEYWRLEEKHDYFANLDQIRQTLVTLANLETIEPKTKRPKRYRDLAVADVETADGAITSSIQVTVAAGSDTLANLLVGQTRPADIGGGVFVRKVGDEQAWLASGSLQPPRKALQWLERNIVNIDSRRIKQVTLTHSGGESVTIEKSEIDSEDMAYTSPVPEGREPKPVHEMNAMANIMDFLILEDVRPAAELDWSNPVVTSSYLTYDGLLIRMAAVKDGDATWFKLSAEPAEVDPRLAQFVADNKGKDSAQGRMADEMKSEEEVASEIAAITDRVGEWAYRLTEYKTGKATATPEDLLQNTSRG
jgi:hypothetical protein